MIKRSCLLSHLPKLSLVLLFALFISSSLFAQNIVVTGKVTGPEGNAAIGVSVRVKGNTTGTATDVNGNYSINVPGNGVLEFTSIGFEPL